MHSIVRATAALACALLLLVCGIWVGGHPSLLPAGLRDTLVGDDEAQVYQEAVDLLEADYYRPLKGDQLLDTSLARAVEGLDDQFSAYFSPREFRSFQETTSGAFEGIGTEVVEVPEGLRIDSVYEESPAKAAGLQAGDVIVEAAGQPLKGKSSRQSTALIKGKAGTEVVLVLERDGRRLRKDVERAKVDVPVVAAETIKQGGARYERIELASFTAGAHGEVGVKLREALERGTRGVVLDLRGNGGGLLNEAVLLTSLFIDEGRVVSTKGRSRPEKVYEATGDPIDPKGPLVVLVDEGSASASEIVTGALRDRKRATVVGTRTFGKGVFQEVKQLSNGGALDMTVGEYFTPNGDNLGGGGVKKGAGITPQVKAQDDPKTERDEALAAAVRELDRIADAQR